MQRRRILYFGLIGACLLAAILRWHQIRESLWLDELHTAWCASGTWHDVAPRARIGNHSPLYFYLPKLTIESFGPSEITLRLPSLVAGLILVAGVGALVFRWTESPTAGVLAATLVAIDRHCIFYAQEARPYALLQLFAWGHAAVTWNLVRRPNWLNHLLFIAGGIVLFHLHYTAALFVAAELLFLGVAIWVFHKDVTYSVKHLLLDATLILVGSLPAAWHVATVAARREQWQTLVADVSRIGLQRMLQLDFYLFWPVLAVIGGWLWHRYRGKLTWPHWDKRAVLLVLCTLGIPLSAAWMATVFVDANLLTRRYLLPTYVGVIVLAALVWSTIPWRWLRVLVAVVIVAASAAGLIRQYATDGRLIVDRRQDWRAAVRFINANRTKENEMAVVRSGFLEERLLLRPHDSLLDEFCLAPVRGIYRLDVEAYPLSTPSPAEFDETTRNKIDRHAATWFVVAGSDDTRRRFVPELKEEFSRRGAQWSLLTPGEFGSILVVQAIRSAPK